MPATTNRWLAALAALALFSVSCALEPQPLPTPLLPTPTPSTAEATPDPAPSPRPTEPPAPTPFPSATPTVATRVTGGQLKIVSSLPRLGPSKKQTDAIVNAIRMALEEVNYQVAGFTLQYEDLDDSSPARGTWDPAREADNARRAGADPDVVVYLGTYNSGAAQVAIPVLCRASLVMISPANTYPGLTKKVAGVTQETEPEAYYPGCARNYTRTIPTDDVQGAVDARWARDLGARRPYILDDGSLYGRTVATAFGLHAVQQGLEVVGGPEHIDTRATAYHDLAARVRETGPDLIFFGGSTQSNAGRLWKDLKAAMPEVRMMGTDGIFEEAFLAGAGDAAEATFVTFGGILPSLYTDRARNWLDRYRERYGADPEVYAIYGYEAARVALDAILRAGKKDRAAIRDAVLSTRQFTGGVLGAWSFDGNGDTTLTAMSAAIVRNGRFRPTGNLAVTDPPAS